MSTNTRDTVVTPSETGGFDMLTYMEDFISVPASEMDLVLTAPTRALVDINTLIAMRVDVLVVTNSDDLICRSVVVDADFLSSIFSEILGNFDLNMLTTFDCAQWVFA